jgi:hypothetical protein
MKPADFKRSLAKAQPPAGLSPALAVLWWAGKDDWQRAHQLVMHEGGADCAWVHAYLHRLEGDLDNARYWYRQAKRAPARCGLEAEWVTIAAALLEAASP